MHGLAPRTAAWRVLHDLHRGIPFDLALQRAIAILPEPDKGLAHEIAAGVLRHRSAIDAALAPHIDRGLAGIKEDLLDILRLGGYQLLYLDRIPRHAAVDTAVALGRRVAGARVGGFINAVLRKVERSGAPPDATDADGLADAYSHPAWLVDRWRRRFGPADTERLLQWNNTRPPLVIQPARWETEALIAAFAQQGVAWDAAPFGAGMVVRERRPQELPGFASGSCYVQDPAQAMVVRFCEAEPGRALFDACAAPGGKTIALSRRGFVAAGDLRLPRARRLRENLIRAAPGPAAALVADASHPPIRAGVDVLLDAPCLGTGSFARHPDARWRVTQAALAGLAAQGSRLLRALAEVVRPGGLLFFATCSLEPEENEVQIESFLAADPRFRREPPATLPGEVLTGAGDMMLLPHLHGTDGAYAARLRRVG